MLEWLEKTTRLDLQVFCLDNIDQNPVPGCFGDHGTITYLDMLLLGWGWTLLIAGLGLLLALIAGSIIGVMRTLPNSPWAVRFGNGWVEFFRNIPLLVHVFLWYFVVPALFPPVGTFLQNHQGLGAMLLMVCALGFFTSARIAEQVSAGILSLPKGQRYAGMALGFTTTQSYRYVLLPMAYRIIIPPLTSESMNIFKNASVAVAVGITELIFMAQQIAEETARPTESYLAVTVCYFISAMAINRLMAYIEKKVKVPGLVAHTGGGH